MSKLEIICPLWVKTAINNGYLKTSDFIKWLISENYATTEKPIEKTAIIDLNFKGFEGKKVKSGYFDRWGTEIKCIYYFG